MLNGEPVRRICHHRGVCQADPLSSILFLLVMESLQLLFRKVQQTGMLNPLHASWANFKVSLYVNDMAVFINPTTHELAMSGLILRLFGEASGLIANLDKTEFFPIQCHNLDMEQLLGINLALSSPVFTLDYRCIIKSCPRE
jgi:hypothetical protein